MCMTSAQVKKTLELIGGQENIFQILLNNERRYAIYKKEDYDNITFDHDNELLVIEEHAAGRAIPVKSIFPYAIVEGIIGIKEEWIDPMVIDNKWREVLRSKSRMEDVNGVIEAAMQEREELKDYNNPENRLK